MKQLCQIKPKIKNQNLYCGTDMLDLMDWEREYLLEGIIEKAIENQFPLENYFIFDIPFIDEIGEIWYFLNKKEYLNYHDGYTDQKISEISFYVHYQGDTVIPLYSSFDKLFERKTCQEAVSYEMPTCVK